MESKLIDCTYTLLRPFKAIMPEALHDRLARDLYQSQNAHLPEEWFTYSIGLSAFSLILFIPLLYALLSVLETSHLSALPLSLLLSVVVFLLILLQPAVDRRRFTAEFEADMSIALLVLGISLDTDIRFREALERVAAGFGHFSVAIAKTLKETQAGTALPDALERMATSVDSIYLRRAVGALKNAYKVSGPRGRPLASLAEEMLKGQEATLREYTAKSGLLSQGSTIFTIVFPTLFISLLMVSSVITRTTLPLPLLSALIGFGFTFLAIMLYQYQISTVPPFVRRLYLSDKISCWRANLERKMRILDHPRTVRSHISMSLLAFMATFSGILLATSLLDLPAGILISLFIAFVTGFLFFLGPSFQHAALQKQVEDALPAVLEQAAQFADKRTEATILTLAQLGHGRLSREFAKAHAEMKAGASVESALRRVSRDMDSELVRRANDLIIQAHKTGINMRAALLQTAAYVRRIKFIMQESKAATFGERATQIFGFFISATLFGIVVSMGQSLGQLLAGGFFDVDLPLLAAIAFGIQLNLLILPFVISYNVAYLENDMKRVLFYLPTLLLVGNLLFHSTRQISFL